MPRLRTLAASLLIAISLAGCRSKTREPIPAPDFQLKDLAGRTVTLSSLRGHPVMLDFWATWCGPCQMSIPLVQSFYEKHKAEGLVVLGMNVDDDPSGVYAFAKHFHVSYPILYAAGTPASEAYQVEGLPTFVFIDAQGRITHYFEGFRPEMVNAWEAEFQRAKTTTH